MKKHKNRSFESRNEKNDLNAIFRNRFNADEKAVNTTSLNRDVSDEFRDYGSQELPANAPNTTNWSAPEDRGEDLINERDPFTQQQERDTEIPPELIQERAYRLFEQRAVNSGDNLADWFDAERQLRSERTAGKKTKSPAGYSQAN